MQQVLAVMLGGGIGAAMRFGMSGALHRFLGSDFHYGTFVVNVLGSFILGILVEIGDTQQLIPVRMVPLLTIGFCGGFTTFSTFAFESVSLLTQGKFFEALFNILANVLVCVIAVYAGMQLMKAAG
ncbi:MAG: fluoride efflux transporter CrcB [Ectothiorhodospiraceae bacterium]|nr:fluoride efflux transporter CrcB [Ectothiorhodospiraceae bacterium]